MTTATIDAVVVEALVSGTGSLLTDSVVQEVLVSGTGTATVDAVFVESLVSTTVPPIQKRNIPRALLIR